MAGQPAIDVRNLVKRYGDKTVVDQVSLTLQPGRICGFLGPNGSGKTTTLRMMCGLLTPDEGSGTCLGYDVIRDRLEIKRRSGYMTQKFGLYEDLSIRENLEFVARMYALDREKARVDEALEHLGLATRQRQLAGTLSGGWKQRLALAACMLHEPQLLLLDEPTAGVDPQARRDFWEQIHTFAGRGVTVMVSTHYMDEAERCHDIAYIVYGHLLARGTPDEIVKSSGLFAYTVEGAGVNALLPLLHNVPGIAAAPFGTTLHVSAESEAALERAVKPYLKKSDVRWVRSEPTLEDVFIALMRKVPDNVGGSAG